MNHSLEIGDIYCYNFYNKHTNRNYINVHINIFNISNKTIKYITFTTIPYNKVYDQVYCTLTNKSEVNLKFTGPLYSYDPTDKYLNNREGTFNQVWSNTNICDVKITKIHIEYMDGTEEFINTDDIVFFDNPQSMYRKAQEVLKEKMEADERMKRYKIISFISLALFIYFLILALSPDMPPISIIISLILAIISGINFIIFKFKPKLIENIIKYKKNYRKKK